MAKPLGKSLLRLQTTYSNLTSNLFLLHTNYTQLYWAGPILGGIAASLLYTQVFSAPEIEVTPAIKYRTDVDEKEVRRNTLVL